MKTGRASPAERTKENDPMIAASETKEPAGKALPAPTIYKLTNALDQAVTALVNHKKDWPTRSSRPNGQAVVLSFADMDATSPEVLRARQLASDPVTAGLGLVIREIGQLLLDALGSFHLLRDVAEKVARRDR